MPTQLGQLYYSLGLDSSNFDSKIKELAQGLNGKLAGKLGIDKSSIEQAIRDTRTLREAILSLSQKVTVNITGIPKTSNIDITANLTNADSIKAHIETALQGVTVRDVQVDTASAKKAFDAQIWNVKVTTDRNHIQELVNKIKSIMGVNKISVKVTPDWSRMDMARLQKTLQNAIGNIPLKNIKVYVDRKYIQDQLNKMNFTATVDIKVNKASAQQAVQGAINSAQNLNNGGGGGNGGNSTTEIIRTQNKALTDQLGIRRSINDQMSRNTQLATMLGNAMGNVFGAYMIKNFLENLIQIGGEIQKQRLALGHIIDSATNANLLFEQMKQLAVKSPFGLLDLMQNARQLSAFGVEYNNLYDTMKRLSDMAAGLGIQFSRLALAYGETKERGFLDGKLVRQFSYMGLPVLQKVAEYYTQIDKLQNGGVVTASQVRSMVSDKQVSFEDVDAVIKKMTEEGGQFYNMQEVMAESVAGKWKNLRDAIDIMYSDIVDGNSALLKAPATILTSLAKNYDQLVAILQMVAVRLGMTAAQNAIGTAVLSRNTQALVLNSKAQKEAMATAIQKIGTYKKLTAAEAEQLATISAMNNAQLRQFIVDKQLTKGELERLIMMKQLTNEQKQYIIQLGLMTENEVKTAAGMTRIGMAARTVGTAIKSMFTGWNVAFLALTAAWSIYEYFDSLEEKYKQFTDDMAQSTKDFEKATADIASEVNGLDFDSMSVGERTTEIKAMVEYIKDEVPGAAQKLQEIFAVDKDGKFVNSTRARYDALKAIVDQMDELSHTDLTTLQNHAYNIFDSFDVTDSANSFFKARAEMAKNLENMLNAMTSDVRGGLFDKFKETYKNEIANALNLSNLDDVKKLSQDKIKSLILSNTEMLNNFLTLGGKETVKSLNYYKSFVKEYENVIDRVVRSAKSLKDKFPKDTNWTLAENQNKWQQVVERTIKVKYKEESSEVQQLIMKLMEDPNLLAKLYVQGETNDQTVKRLLADEPLRQSLFLNVQTMYNGKVTEDPWADIMKGVTGKVKTEGTILEKRDNIKEQVETAYIALKELMTLSKYASKVKKGQKVGENGLMETVWESIVGDDEKVEDFAQTATTMQKNLDAAKLAALNLGLDTAKIIAEAEKKFNKSENGSSKKEDTVLKEFKERVDNFKKAYSEFQKWSAKVGKEKAGQKLGELGLLGGMDVKDLASPEAYLNRIKKLIEEWKGKVGNDVNRKKELNALLQLQADVELNITDESIKRATEKVQREINDAAKQYDLWKAWFEATGDKDLALKMSVSVTPVFDERVTDLQKQLNDALKGFGVNLNAFYNNFAFSKNISQKDMLDYFKAFDPEGGEALYNKYKAIYDLAWQTGQDLTKGAAEAVKSMMSYEEKVAVLEKERQDRLKGAGDNVALQNQINASYDAKVAELDPQYKQFMSNVTTLTKAAAETMGAAIKNRLTNELQAGAKSVEEYSNAMQKVDKQLEESRKRIKSFGEAWLLGKTNEYNKTRYENTSYNKRIAEDAAFAAQKKLAEKSGNLNPEDSASMTEYQMALADNVKAQEKLRKAIEEETKAYKKYQQSEDDNKNLLTFDGIMNKFSAAISGISTLSKTFEKMFGEDNVLSSIASVGSSITESASALKSVGQTLGGDKGGIIGAFVGTFVGGISAGLDYTEKHYEEGAKNAEKAANAMERYADRLEGLLDKNAGGLYNYTLDSKTKSKLQEIANSENITLDADGVIAALRAFYSKGAGENAKSALENNSYFDAQIALMKEQRYELTQQSAAISNMKGDHSGEIEDIAAQIADLDDEIANFASDLAKNLYGIDVTSWASSFADALVQAWQKGESAADAYKEAVNSVLADVAKSVVQQQILGTYLDSAIKPWLEKFADAKGVMNQELFGELGVIFSGLQSQIDMSQTFLDAWEQTAQQYGYSMKETSDSSVSNSIKGVSEETADVLAALVQGIRLDTSKQVELLQRIADNVAPSVGTEAIPEESEANVNLRRMAAKICGDEGSVEDEGTNLIAQAQLTQLQQIASHTLRNAEAAEAMRETLDAVVNGTKAWNIQ